MKISLRRLSLAGAATSTIFVATKHVFCHEKSMLAATKRLSRQNYALSRVCRDKHTFVATKDVFLSQQNKHQTIK